MRKRNENYDRSNSFSTINDNLEIVESGGEASVL